MSYKDSSRYEIYTPSVVTHRGKVIRDITTSVEFNNFYSEIGTRKYKIAVLSAGMAGRPDLISQAAYGTPGYWWVIILANNVNDIKEDLAVGEEIKIPVL
jgi:hypothetical protein